MGREYFAVLAIGKDSPGIVAALTGVLSRDHGCNIETSQMMIVGGYFAATVVASTDATIDCEAIERDLLQAGDGVGVSRVRVTPSEPGTAKPSNGATPTHTIEASAGDRPGVLYEIADSLASNAVNITGLISDKSTDDDSHCAIALEVRAPDSMRRESLEEALVSVLPEDVAVRVEDWHPAR